MGLAAAGILAGASTAAGVGTLNILVEVRRGRIIRTENYHGEVMLAFS